MEFKNLYFEIFIKTIIQYFSMSLKIFIFASLQIGARRTPKHKINIYFTFYETTSYK